MNASARTIGSALLASAALLLVSACGSSGESAPSSVKDQTSVSAPAEDTTTTKPSDKQAKDNKADAPTPEELRFSARTLDGSTFNGTSLAGEPAVLWFWAPWCPNCQREAPTIADAEATHGEQVTFVGVAARDEVSAMKDFATKYGIDGFTNLNDANAAVWARFGVTYQPAFAFIGADGSVDVVKGSLSAEELDVRLSAMAG
ncbi:protein disulfide oxidoreductase [Haloechinothrix halophila]|uniref:protein disulfide oxidoreductase n=1 Tax=Haloechinothrix halophila TaxID=1069073 RepID=UPI0004086947|nr:protein disulfide oxidoreductase [Haloechinothrix halophila]